MSLFLPCSRLSVSNDLKHDAERDLRDIGAGKIEVHALNKVMYMYSDLVSSLSFETKPRSPLQRTTTVGGMLNPKSTNQSTMISNDFCDIGSGKITDSRLRGSGSEPH